jgi:hypothetical protein
MNTSQTTGDQVNPGWKEADARFPPFHSLFIAKKLIRFDYEKKTSQTKHQIKE